MEKGPGKLLHLEIDYTISDCESRTNCKDSFDVYVHPMSSDEQINPLAISSDRWKQVTTITLFTPKQIVGRDKRSVVVIDYIPETEAVMFAIKEKSVCMVVYRMQVYFNACPATAINQIQLPETIVSADAYVPTYFHAHCVKNAVDVSNANADRNVFCQGNGQWKIAENTRCQCDAGYTSTKHGTCSACQKGSYKGNTGNEVCKACPRNSYSHESASSICDCEVGFYRADNEDPSNDCSQPPSAPLNLKVTSLRQSEAVLTWAKPSYMGHRGDIYYSFTCETCNDDKDCDKCPTSVTSNFNSERIVTHEVALSKLEPGRQYIVTVFANNGVSKKALNVKNSMRIAFITKKANNYKIDAPTMLSHENNGTLVISWPATDNNSKYTNVYYQIELKNKKEVILHDSSHNAMKIENVDVYEAHTVRVRVNDARSGWSQWSDILSVKNKFTKNIDNNDVIIEDGHQKVGDRRYFNEYIENSNLVYICICLILISLVVGIFCYLNSKRIKKGDYFAELVKSRELHSKFGVPSSHMYYSKQYDPQFTGCSFADGTINKNYVDPSTYGDLTVAMRQFTRQIPRSNILMTNESLGVGEFGQVEKGVLFLTGNLKTASVAEGAEITVACKTLKKGATDIERKLFTMEATTMGQFQHDNVLRLLGIVGTKNVEIIITEFMINGSLINFLKVNSINTCSKVQLVQMCLDISEGMEYLHQAGYIHRDLASRNILLDQFYRCKISDFGLSRNGFSEGSEEMEYTNAMAKKIPIRWTAPEALEKGTYTAASDIWSYGVVMWEIFSFGERPYYDWPHRKIYEEVLQGYRLPKSLDCPESMYQVMTTCWNHDRNERPTFAAITPKLRAYLRIYEECMDYSISPLYQIPSESACEANCLSRGNCKDAYPAFMNSSKTIGGPYSDSTNISSSTITDQIEKSELSIVLARHEIEYLFDHLSQLKITSVAHLANLPLGQLSEMHLSLSEQKQLAVAIDSIVTTRRPQSTSKNRINPYTADPSFRSHSIQNLTPKKTDGGFFV
uniref:Receptor protein-tyrosine kinase n=1 Tax=Rhabditophanes sp. KR3021 TaxID=114890 RepID=A0AC35U021_9BILA